MGKKSQRRREAKAVRSVPGASSRSPSVPTIFRLVQMNEEAMRQLERMMAVRIPQVFLRDSRKVEQINAARTAEDLLGLAPIATGLAESRWQERTSEFGNTIVPLMMQRLKVSSSIANEEERTLVVERIIAALRRHGSSGAAALLESFPHLDVYGQSLASIIFGLMGVADSVDIIWGYYESVKARADSLFIGALWGLIDLKDVRVGGALAELAARPRRFYELYGFLALAGDSTAVIPLGNTVSDNSRTRVEREDAAMALVAIGRRMGRQALAVEIGKASRPGDAPELVEKTVDQILTNSTVEVEEYFDLFYHGLNPQRAQELLRI